MERPTILLAAALLVVSAGSAAVIWSQHNRIQALAARNLEADHDRATMRRRLAAAAAPTPAESATEHVADTAQEAARRGPRQAEPSGRGGENFEAPRFMDMAAMVRLMADPEIASLMLSQQKGALDQRYAALFRQLGLDPQQTEALRNLLAERQLARMEAGVMARAEGLDRDNRGGMRELFTEANNDTEQKLQALLGPDRFNTLKTYEQTLNERARVDQFALRLSYSPAPLQSYQSDALVQALASVKYPRLPGRSATEAETAVFLGAIRAYDAKILARSQAVLSPAQLEALRQFQQEQADRIRLGTLLPGRERGPAGRPGG